MNKAFAINYDLRKPDRDYTGLSKAIKQGRKWWHYLESCWLIITDETPDQIFDTLKPHIDKDDRLLIIEVRDNVQGWLTDKAWNWIHTNVPS